MSSVLLNKLMGEGEAVKLPLLPLRDVVVFPHMMVPLFVGRHKSIRALDEAFGCNRLIFLVTQKNAQTDEPEESDIHQVGTICQIIQLLKLPDGTVKVLVEGKLRGSVVGFHPAEGYFLAAIKGWSDIPLQTPETEALVRTLKNAFETFVKLCKKNSEELLENVADISDPARLMETMVSHVNFKVQECQELLEIVEPLTRLEKFITLLEGEIEILQLEKKIRSRVKRQMEKNQKEYYLQEQIRAIQKELGTKDEFRQEMTELEEKISQIPLSREAAAKAASDLKKLKLMSPLSAEAAVLRNYLDWLVTLPWGKIKREKKDIAEAEKILHADHYGLDKVKERVLEYLSVQALVKKMKGPIMCLVGPPGVGKTSLARSIARATGRDFVKISLGGVRDEAEIRGHRRTYVGAMPGKIIQSLKRTKSSNPVMLLDEIDKMGSDFRGDPSSALLEVLDPEQNVSFADHFLDVEYDLSRILFITTANSLHSIPRPLLDRMETIQIEGYTEYEKLAIARQYLLLKQRAAHGLKEANLILTNDGLLEIVRRYTREAGVRNLERKIATICRKVAHRFLRDKVQSVTIQQPQINDFLGVPRYSYGKVEDADAVGVVTGLAWTETGGELLNVEVAVLPGKGKLTITGKLGDVMQESAHAALSYVRSRGQLLGLDREFYQSSEIHIHVPEGAIPKDGPSAGITMATAMISALTGRAVRRDIAMTGEITLRGRILPIGGLTEKLLAAKRGGIVSVIVPKANGKDLADVPPEVREGSTIITTEHMDEVLCHALVGELIVSGEYSNLPRAENGQEAVAPH